MISSAGEPKTVVTGYPAATAGSSYPYPAPPPASYYPNGHPPPPPPQPLYYPTAYPAAAPPPRYNTAFLRRLLSIAVALFLLFGLVTLIVWLVLRPRLPEFTVSSATVSGFNFSTSQQLLSADFDLNLTVHNPNSKMGIYYDHVTAVVLYDSDALVETSLAPFYQAKGAATALRARLVAVGMYVDSNIVKGINSDRGRGDGAVHFQVRVSAWVRFKPGAWKTRWHMMRVYCDDVPIGLRNGTSAAATGYLVGSTPKKCVVNL
ncbi:Late embryogenesis abundant protein [Musa troglodytarum]|uniref:Late embryogenesis abundant protein n=1 Tax=Musa troglodytarum TaxID=320322 RepID=A0A9E7HX43_9LILI|nr:Late embryogenesis abundant protein [Musa troglodytarum]URE38654.1 Late embryogenesis abundant protein [Musa troglodytarum]